jgi:hypothetical protein
MRGNSIELQPSASRRSTSQASATAVDPDSARNTPSRARFSTTSEDDRQNIRNDANEADIGTYTINGNVEHLGISEIDEHLSKNSPPSQQNVEEDLEGDLDSLVPGWPRVAMLMAKTPGLASYSRFRDLNTKSLLYYQAELTDLRSQLHTEEWSDYRRGDEKARKFAARADFLVNSVDRPNGKQMKLIKKIRGVLKEYSKSRHSSISEPQF